MTASAEPLRLNEGRFSRFEAIEWWDQSVMRAARVLVVGAGALGNEVIKNLALLGVGNIAIIDMDTIEESNLVRSVLFRASDEGRSKAECAAAAARDLYSGVKAHAIHGNLLADVGLGWFRWARIVVGALDNREARVFVNSACAQLGRPWIDGGIDVLNGIVRGFAPPETACYECTMGRVDWDLLNKRRSCSLLARRALDQGGVPTTPTTASVVGAMQAQEVVKWLHGKECLLGAGFVFEGLGHSSYRIEYSINPNCPYHDDPPSEVASASMFSHATPIREVWGWAEEKLGGLDAIDCVRELVRMIECPACGWTEDVYRPAEGLVEEQLLCPKCKEECSPEFIHSIGANEKGAEKSIGDFGLPRWDILWARHGSKIMGIELSGDAVA